MLEICKQGMGQENQFIRRDAIVETLGEMYPDMQVVIEGAGDWKRDKALQLVETWLQSGTDIDAILCLNDDMAMGTQLAVEQAGKSDDNVCLQRQRGSGWNQCGQGRQDCCHRIPESRPPGRGSAGGSFAVYSRGEAGEQDHDSL